MKIRNSDILFGRIITSYKWIDKETARESIQEVGALQGFGIDKRLHQVLFERSKVGVDEIYAVLEILLSMQKIPKIKTLITYLFTDDDDQFFVPDDELPLEEAQTTKLKANIKKKMATMIFFIF